MSNVFGDQQQLVESQYKAFVTNPMGVDDAWRTYFAALPAEVVATLDASAGRAHKSTAQLAATSGRSSNEVAWRMSRIATAFRSRGHYYAQIDPLGLTNATSDDLTPERFGLSEADLDVEVETDIFGLARATPRAVFEKMSRAYCGSVGWEVMQIENVEEREWLLERIEGSLGQTSATSDERRWILEKLTDAQEIERFLHTQYVGAKRFSLEGLESLIPMMHAIIDQCGDNGVKDVVIGMAHRGRLNVLVNIMHKQLHELFSAFNDQDSEGLVGKGDVKYHLGYDTDHRTPGGNDVHLSLCFNPSHLEFVNPVVVGRARARLDRTGDKTGRSVLPVAIHGDAAFMGQGIVMETLNLAELEGFRTGGTIHLVLNNQVGFTTSPSDARSSRYSSDIVRFMRVPVFHVNADDLEAVLRVTRLAAEYRQKFLRDVCIDLVGYRRFGHNEGDEPRFTQPVMYRVIDDRKTIRDAYAEHLATQGVITAAEDQALVEGRRARMMAALTESRERPIRAGVTLVNEQRWAGYTGGAEANAGEAPTGIPLETLQSLLAQINDVTAFPNAHDKVRKLYEQRARSVDPSIPMDWGTAETLAYASLAAEGHHIRLTGQDVRRGTFSHRHAYFTDTLTGQRHTLINRVATAKGYFEAFDSSLSEASVLGFEYGYSLEEPAALCLWEAQFGDFANGAQVIIDQFIASGEDKWGRLTGLTMLLPHGYEGQGPEHSYARLDRFLALCAEDNMQVVDVTTPAQVFHLLRRQVKRAWRKPLVVMAPKSLLRHKSCVSSLTEMATGSFQRIIGDVSGSDPAKARRVLLCSGRLYYDLEAERARRNANDVHIVRLEQLYPLDVNGLTRILGQYRPGTQLVWAQDEPWNIGAWYFIKARLQAIYGDGLPLQCIARAESASPSTGSLAAHRLENHQLLQAAFAGVPSQVVIGSD
jgi:2-oxoglutarate dehydrogenase E1 component